MQQISCGVTFYQENKYLVALGDFCLSSYYWGDVAQMWTHDTCKSNDNCNVLLSRPPTQHPKSAHSPLSPPILNSSPLFPSLSSNSQFSRYQINICPSILFSFYFYRKYTDNFLPKIKQTRFDLQISGFSGMRSSRLTSPDGPSSSPVLSSSFSP